MPDVTPLLALLRDDPRVVGVARLSASDERTRLLVVTTWDGRDALAARLPELAATLVAGDDVVALHDDAHAATLAPDGCRLELAVVRVGDLKPSSAGEGATPLLDDRGLLAQWVAWSHGRPRTPPGSADHERDSLVARVLRCDDALRALGTLAPGSALVAGDDARPLRHALATALRVRIARLPDGPGSDGLRARAREALRAFPQPAAGLRIDGSGARERFLAVADEEGFLGDRMLLDAAETHVRVAAGREPVFEVGFALATFDQVEARYALGDAVGGCKPPLVPGLLVGVAVTPADALELWAAPTVREPTCAAACVADDGGRTVVERTGGRDALLDALTGEVDEALDALPSLLRRARGAHHERPEDPEALLRSLHLPRSFVLASAAHGAVTRGTTRLLSALAVARAATDMEPIVARKLELAAGRLLLGAPERDDHCATS